jgi:hypothetical protein
MSVNSTENKGLLWQLLSNHPHQKSDPKKFQSVLEYRVNEIHAVRFKFGNNLMVMNKEIIKKFSQEVKQSNQSNAQATKAPTLTKEQTFGKKLKVQQKNFNDLINKQKPAEIDFSDNTEETPIDARMVDNTLQEREQELKKIMAQYGPNENSAKEWLTGESTNSNIKIDTDSNINIQPTVIKEKHVRFEEPGLPFLQKLKKTDDVFSYLKRIENKQDIIIALLETKS